MTHFARLAAMALMMSSGLLRAQDAPAGWIVTEPVAGSPLRQAALTGKGKAGKAEFSAVLTLTCRADQPVMQLALEVPDAIPGWDVSPFEGPQGIGQRRSLLTVSMKNSRFTSRHRVSGWRSGEHAFAFGWKPDNAFLERVPVTGTHLVIKIEAAKRRDPVLEAEFDFPEDASAMLGAVSACRAEAK
ncbi:hypothetical protein [Paludibacterium paludis]|uniref:Invasion protein IalB n=1 Tax=Paludibacterium paludis TaxID=1225769 RepID=A0A918P4A9_9NEIS|nr:hypothetical protein [Paludibacterium paludis]GGY18528.1 hypothetical protein GCM10011289_22550 [Paludibacterium paludis]